MLKIKNELYFYDIYPKVLPVGQQVTLTIRALQKPFQEDGCYKVQIHPINGDTNPIFSCTLQTKNGALTLTHAFVKEQEYSIRILNPDQQGYLTKLSVYALEADLLSRKPLIGDLHVHTFFSDGKESPEVVASMYRQHGFDFISITDHLLYEPSLHAINAYRALDLDFKLYPGEEIHTPGNYVHLVNFGSDSSINDLFRDQVNLDNLWDRKGTPEWHAEIAALQETLTEIPDDVDPFIHASCLWAISKVREANGMCILPHPHWLADVRNLSDSLTSYYLKNGLVDAFELIGGQSWHENMTQIALYHQLQAEGAKIPIVGSSDSHGTVNPQWGNALAPQQYFTEERTMVFAEENSKDAIISAVKGMYSVAIDHYVGQDFHIHGPYRLVQYALFLQEEYLPLHNEMCYEEGRLMRLYTNGSDEAKPRLDALKGQTDRLYRKYFAYPIDNASK